MSPNMKHPSSSPRQRLAWLLVCVLGLPLALRAAPVHLVEESPVSITNVAPGVILVDFGRVAYGNVEVAPPKAANGQIKVRFGEAFADVRFGNSNRPGLETVATSFCHHTR